MEQTTAGILKLAIEGESLDSQREALASLAGLDGRLSDEFEYLSSSSAAHDFFVRRRVAQVLGSVHMEDLPAVSQLLDRLMEDFAWSVREAALDAWKTYVGKFTGDELRICWIPKLVHIATQDRHDLVRDNAVHGLKILHRDDEVVQQLQARLRLKSVIRRRTYLALAEFPEQIKCFQEDLVRGLNDSDRRVRWTVAEQLGRLPVESAVVLPELVKRRFDAYLPCAEAACRSLQVLLRRWQHPAKDLWTVVETESSATECLRQLVRDPRLTEGQKKAFHELCARRLRWWDADTDCQVRDEAREDWEAVVASCSVAEQREAAWLIARLFELFLADATDSEPSAG